MVLKLAWTPRASLPHLLLEKCLFRFPGLAAQEVQRFAQRRIRQRDQIFLHAQG
jgi:hypothetical protein